jgi:hypothetical protein
MDLPNLNMPHENPNLSYCFLLSPAFLPHKWIKLPQYSQRVSKNKKIKFTSHFNAFKMPKIKGLLVEDNCRMGWKKWDGQAEMDQKRVQERPFKQWPAQKN